MQITNLTDNEERRRNEGEYCAPTRFTRMDFSKFAKEDVNAWVSKCERYFLLEGTHNANMVTMASLSFDESSYNWFQVCEGIELKMQGLIFNTQAIVIPIGGCDIILGMQWLRELGKVLWDCSRLEIEFLEDGKKVKLTTDNPTSSKVVPRWQLSKIEEEKDYVFMLQLIPTHQKESCCAIKGFDDNGAPMELMELLGEYDDVFSKPEELPTSRGIHDHKIVLKEGSNLISCRP